MAFVALHLCFDTIIQLAAKKNIFLWLLCFNGNFSIVWRIPCNGGLVLWRQRWKPLSEALLLLLSHDFCNKVARYVIIIRCFIGITAQTASFYVLLGIYVYSYRWNCKTHFYSAKNAELMQDGKISVLLISYIFGTMKLV